MENPMMRRVLIVLLVCPTFSWVMPHGAAAPNAAPPKRILIPLPQKPRVLVAPGVVGYPHDYPFPVSKERLTFECPNCGLKMFTHGVYPHLPHCPKPKCRCCPMLEIDAKPAEPRARMLMQRGRPGSGAECSFAPCGPAHSG